MRVKQGNKWMLLLACVLLAAGIFIWQIPGGIALAEQTVQDDPEILSNEEGQEVVINVEEELSAEEAAAQEEALTGAIDLGDEAVPLAGFDSLGAKEDYQMHAGWMAALLLAAIAYAVYFSWYQNRMFDLRRKVAEAESRISRKERF